MDYRMNTADTVLGFLSPEGQYVGVRQLLRALNGTGRNGLSLSEAIQRSSLDITDFIKALGAATNQGAVEAFTERGIQRLRVKR